MAEAAGILPLEIAIDKLTLRGDLHNASGGSKQVVVAIVHCNDVVDASCLFVLVILIDFGFFNVIHLEVPSILAQKEFIAIHQYFVDLGPSFNLFGLCQFFLGHFENVQF